MIMFLDIENRIKIFHKYGYEFSEEGLVLFGESGNKVQYYPDYNVGNLLAIEVEGSNQNFVGKKFVRTMNSYQESKPVIKWYRIEGDEIIYDDQLRKDEYNAALKLSARKLLEQNPKVGDIPDQLAAVDKRVDLITPVLLNLLIYVIEGTPIPAEKLQNYLAFAHNFVDAVNAGVYLDRADIEDAAIMIPALMEQRTVIANTVKTEYLDKKV